MKPVTVILALVMALLCSSRAAAAIEDSRECLARLAAIKSISGGEKASESDPALAWFFARGADNDACLLSELRDRTPRGNPFKSDPVPVVANSEVALFILARANGFKESTCFPDSLLEQRHESPARYHEWFVRSAGLDGLAGRCRDVVAAFTASVVDPGPERHDPFPRWSCIAALKQVRDGVQMRRRFSGMSRSEAGCMIEALDAGELTPAPAGTSKYRDVPVSELALLALFDGPFHAAVQACDPAATDAGALLGDFEHKLPDPRNRKELRRCLLGGLGMNDEPSVEFAF
ncbi:MAG TPA: hypothetical protein VGH80_10495 [Xanthomonadaceae bacterium]|jgi:hypothetical protein